MNAKQYILKINFAMRYFIVDLCLANLLIYLSYIFL